MAGILFADRQAYQDGLAVGTNRGRKFERIEIIKILQDEIYQSEKLAGVSLPVKLRAIIEEIEKRKLEDEHH